MAQAVALPHGLASDTLSSLLGAPYQDKKSVGRTAEASNNAFIRPLHGLALACYLVSQRQIAGLFSDRALARTLRNKCWGEVRVAGPSFVLIFG